MGRAICEECGVEFKKKNRYEPSSRDYCSEECYEHAVNGYKETK